MGDQAATTRKALKESKKGPFLKAYAHYGQVSGAAEDIGISRDTVYEWKESDPAFKKAFDDTKFITVDKLKGVIIKKGMEGDVAAAKLCLQWLAPDEFTDRHKIEFQTEQIPKLVAAFVNIIRRHVPPERMQHIQADIQAFISLGTSASSHAPIAVRFG